MEKEEHVELIDVKEAARRLGRSQHAVWALVRRGRIPRRGFDRRVLIAAKDLLPFFQEADHIQPLRVLGNSTQCA